MLLTPMAVLVGLVVGRLRGGSVTHLRAVRFRGRGALLISISVIVVGHLVVLPVGLLWQLLAWTALVVITIANLRLVGASIVLCGLVLNLMVQLLNGGMPVTAEAATKAGITDPGPFLSGERHLAQDSDRLLLLSQRIAFRPTGTTLSFGDLIALVGIADVVTNAMLSRRRFDGAGRCAAPSGKLST